MNTQPAESDGPLIPVPGVTREALRAAEAVADDLSASDQDVRDAQTEISRLLGDAQQEIAQ